MGRAEDSPAAVALLRACGAESMEHPGGTLLAHLTRVRDRLADWGARPALQLAGLCHAFYGTDGFPHPLLPPERRAELRDAIGAEAEELVYLYASCDREVSYPELQRDDAPYRDRFTGTTSVLSPARRRDFAELTAANELDIASVSEEFRAEWGPDLLALLTRLRPLLTDEAWRDACRLLLLPTMTYGQVCRGVVTEVDWYGVFLRLENGGDGFVSCTELTWPASKFRHPSEMIAVGRRVTAMVLDVEEPRAQVRLSLKALEPDPLPPFARTGLGRVITGPVTKVVPFGVFVRLAPDVEGMVHRDELDGREPQEGDRLTVEVTSIDLARRRVRLAPR